MYQNKKTLDMSLKRGNSVVGQGIVCPDTGSRTPASPVATEADQKLLVEHGRDGLEFLQFFGVLGRLRTSGLV